MGVIFLTKGVIVLIIVDCKKNEHPARNDRCRVLVILCAGCVKRYAQSVRVGGY